MRSDVLAALGAGATYRDAAQAAGIPWRTWCDWSKAVREGVCNDPDVEALVLEARAIYAKASNGMVARVNLASAKDWRAAAWLLEHRQGDPKARHDEKRARYEAEVAKHRAAGTHVERVAITDATDAELAEEARALAAALAGGDPRTTH